jgi:hypothetical protein
LEKLIYPVWKRAGLEGDDFRDQLLRGLAPALLGRDNVRALRIAVVDRAVEEAVGKRMETCMPLPDGMLSIWLDNGGARTLIEESIAARVERFTGYLVTEAEPIVNTLHPAQAGERVYGFCQVVFLQRPPRLSEREWLAIWQGSHTRVAIDTQATFAYRQNVVVRSLCNGAQAFDAIIEENFPPEAMTSEHAFYGVADDKTLQVNVGAMMESCARFIDFDRINVVPMSEYLLKT